MNGQPIRRSRRTEVRQKGRRLGAGRLLTPGRLGGESSGVSGLWGWALVGFVGFC